MGSVANAGRVWNRGQRFRVRVHDCDHLLQFLAARHADGSVDDELQLAGPGCRDDLQRGVLPRLGPASVQGADYRDCS